MCTLGESPAHTRSDRRRLKTRAALIQSAQELMAEGRQNVPVLEITQRADVGLGSFYNHFETKEQLYEAALHDVLDKLGAILDTLTGDLADPAEVFAQSFRLTGRAIRLFPQLSRVLLRNATELISSDLGLAPRVRRDIAAGAAQGRFTVTDVDLAVSLAAGGIISLGALLESQPERDAARSADALTQDLLRVYGVPAEEAAAICSLPLPDLASAAEATDAPVG